MVFSEASIVRIADKHALMIKVLRVLKPGGRFIASNWLIGHDHALSPDRVAYIAAAGLDFGMASPWRYQDAMRSAGFVDVSTTSRNAWYRETAKQELERLRGPLGLYPPGARVLDVGCGFGDSALRIASAVGPSGQAVGVDCAERLIRAAEADARVAGIRNATFFTADVQKDDLRGPYD